MNAYPTSAMFLSSMLRQVRATLSVDAASLSLSGTFPTASAGLPTEDLPHLLAAAGHGPADEALDSGRPVTIPDLADADAMARYAQYASLALASCIRSVTVIPLVVNGISMGTLHLYRYSPSALSPEQLAEAELIAATIAARLRLEPHTIAHEVAAS